MSWQLFEGDCFDYLHLIEDGSIDMILCDLPYGTTACKWDTPLPLDKLWNEYLRVIKDNGAIVLSGTEPFSSILRTSNLKLYRYDWKWDKVVGSNFINAKKMPLKVYEDIMVFYKGLPVYNPIMTLRDASKMRPATKKYINPITGQLSTGAPTDGNNEKYPINKIKINRLSKELNSKHSLHPTQKPVALFEYLIKTYTNPGDLVLDNCAGSGTTGVACENTHRNSILMEKEPEYCEVIRNRLNELTSQKTLEIGG